MLESSYKTAASSRLVESNKLARSSEDCSKSVGCSRPVDCSKSAHSSVDCNKSVGCSKWAHKMVVHSTLVQSTKEPSSSLVVNSKLARSSADCNKSVRCRPVDYNKLVGCSKLARRMVESTSKMAASTSTMVAYNKPEENNK